MVSIIFILLKCHEKLPAVCVWCWGVTAHRRQAENSFGPSSSGSFSTLLMPWASCQLLEKKPGVPDFQLHRGFHQPGAQCPSGAANTVSRVGQQELPQILTASHIRKRTGLVFRDSVATLLSLHFTVQRQFSTSHEMCPSLCRGTAALQHLRAAAWCFWRHQTEAEKPIALRGSCRESSIHLCSAVSQTGPKLFH